MKGLKVPISVSVQASMENDMERRYLISSFSVCGSKVAFVTTHVIWLKEVLLLLIWKIL